jgi:thiamine-monophosphate kinase
VSLGEFELIDRLLKPLARGAPGALGLADDAAVLAVPAGAELVVAKDAIVAGVHFLPDDPADLVAGKLLRVNLSDLAAMGARPLGYLTAIAKPATLAPAWLEGFAAGLAADQARFGLDLLGGDTVSTPGPLVLTLTILGLVEAGTALLRQGAAPGDLVLVSGTLGDAALGLAVLQGAAAAPADRAHLAARYRTPEPRLALGQALRGLATACIDVSDGLCADLGHILTASGVGAVLRAERLPLSPAARRMPGCREAALTGGDDYELLLTAPPSAIAAIEAAAYAATTPVTVIGEITAAPGLVVLDEASRPVALARTGWRHF